MSRLTPDHIMKTIDLTNQLEANIRARQLRPGDSFFTVREASDFLDVAGMYANQALQLLEKRQIIRRRQSMRATIVEPQLRKETPFSHIYLFISELYYRYEGHAGEPLVRGLQEKFHGVTVSYCLLSSSLDTERALKTIQEVLVAESEAGFVLLSTSFAIQQIFSKSCLPVVIHGTPYSAITNIPNLERDYQAATKQIADWLRSRGRTRWAVLMRNIMHPGDHLALDLMRSQKEVNNDLPILFTGMEPEEISAQTETLFAGKKPPDAIICTSLLQAKAVEECLRAHNFAPYRDIDIVVRIYHQPDKENALYTHIELDIPLRNIGRKIANLLDRARSGGAIESELLPVKLYHTYRETE
ncbi:MAG: hypothetical protein Q4G68_00560 [Planctomycetia bacterium]|nr:hypothetical protein [Planctomycetia bacterium]